MLMYCLLEYSENHSVTSGSLWNFYRNEMNDDANENNADCNYRTNENKTKTSKSFKCNTKRIRSISADNNRLDTEVVVLLKFLSNFWRSFELLLIN